MLRASDETNLLATAPSVDWSEPLCALCECLGACWGETMVGCVDENTACGPTGGIGDPNSFDADECLKLIREFEWPESWLLSRLNRLALDVERLAELCGVLEMSDPALSLFAGVV